MKWEAWWHQEFESQSHFSISANRQSFVWIVGNWVRLKPICLFFCIESQNGYLSNIRIYPPLQFLFFCGLLSNKIRHAYNKKEKHLAIMQ